MVGFPNVICHGMAHQMGFASECNFGFLACVKNEDLYFQYSAYSMRCAIACFNVGMKKKKNEIQLFQI
jgi:hypothetical protein